MRVTRRASVALALGLSLVAAQPAVSAISSGTAGAAAPNWVRSNFETAFGVTVARDCGFSERLPDRAHESLWVFCDTTVLNPQGTALGLLTGSTAARGPTQPGATPTGLSEIPSPPRPLPTLPWAGSPASFVGAPAGLVRKTGAPCTGPAAASWVSGLARIPGTSRLLITYVDVCIEQTWDWLPEGFGMVEYDPASNTFGPRTELFRDTSGRQLTPRLHLGSPVFADGQLYLFSQQCDVWVVGSCATGRAFAARVPVDQRQDPRAYRFSHDGSWTADVAQARSVLPGGRPAGLHVDDYGELDGGRRLVAIEGTTMGGHYRVWEAPDPAGPWSLRTGELSLDGCAAPAEAVDFCRALIGHPDASTAGALAVSYYAAADQHVRMTTVPL